MLGHFSVLDTGQEFGGLRFVARGKTIRRTAYSFAKAVGSSVDFSVRLDEVFST